MVAVAVAITERVKLQRIHEMRGLPPNGYASWEDFANAIPYFEGITFEELTKDDPDPFFLVFDILYLGAKSRNGLLYDEPLVSSIEKQLRGKGAKFGHSSWDSNGTPEDIADWVGVMRVGEVTYAKLYVPPGKARKQLARMKTRKGKIKTSFEGYGVRVPILDDQENDTGDFRLKDFELGAIDLVRDIDAALAAYQSGEPIFVSQTAEQPAKEKPMSVPMTVAEIPQDLVAALRQTWERESKSQDAVRRVSELETSLTTVTTERDTAQAEVTALQTTVAEKNKQIADLETAAQTAAAQLQEARTRIADHEAGAFTRLMESTIAGFTASWNVTKPENKTKLENMNKQFMRALKEALGDNRDADKVKETATTVWKDEFEGIAESLRNTFAGGSAHVGGTGTQTGIKEYSEAEIAAARAEMGV